MTDLSLEVEAQDSPTQRFRKKPIEIQATQWWKNGDHPDDQVGELVDDPIGGESYRRIEGAVVRFFRHPRLPGDQVHECGRTYHDHGWIDTLEGGHIVCPGDWVITGVQGERYPCKPDIFAATYDPAPEPLELTPVEQAATKKSPHMSTCHEPVCVDCAKELRQLRRYIVAIWPVIEKEAAKPLLAEVDRLRRIVTDVIDLTRNTDGDYLHPDSEIPVGEIQRVLYDLERAATDGIDSDGAPVAAALDQSSVGEPEGEQQQ